MSLPVAAGPSPYWYLTRGAGTVALVLLTASVVLGILDFSRWRTDRWPRFLTDALHRNISLMALAIVTVHVLTTLADSFTPIGLRDAFIPFISAYRPLWLGLGALAFDVLLAVAVTSMLRRRLGYGAWRTLHWAAYACWPLALVHGLGTGTDTPAVWMLLLTAGCVLSVLVAIAWRIAAASDGASRRLAAGALASGCVALIVWMASGPLAGHWAARAGTPASLLASIGPTSTAGSSAERPGPSPGLRAPFTARLTGSVRQSVSSETGLASIDLHLSMSGGAKGPLEIRISGQPIAGGGVAMTQSAVSLGPPGQPSQYGGRITALQGSRMVVAASDGASSLMLQIELSIDQATGGVSGTAQARPGGETGP